MPLMGKACARKVAKKPAASQAQLRAGGSSHKRAPKQQRRADRRSKPDLPRRHAAVAAAATAATPIMQSGELSELVGMMTTADAGEGLSAEALAWAKGRWGQDK
jgi:hypothetical protein